MVRRLTARRPAERSAREPDDRHGQRSRFGAFQAEARGVRAHPLAREDGAGLARAGRVDPPRRIAPAAARHRRREARRQDARGLHRRPGRSDPARPRREVPGGVPDRADDGRGAPGGRSWWRAPSPEVHPLLPEAARRPRVSSSRRMSAGHSPPLRYTGMRIKRLEDPRLLTGRGRYLDDLGLPRMLFASFVRSPYAHARIVRIDAAAARALPGVVAVVTADDLRAVAKPLAPRLNGGGFTPTAWPALADGVARFCGEAVATVVATRAYVAADARELVTIEWEAKPVVASIDQARASKQCLIQHRPLTG